jgi:4-hydroxy-4-methyl-2-oxoglutarate aldolase
MISPGDVIVADDDGVCVIPRETAASVLDAAKHREAAEEEKRALYAQGNLSLDLLDGMRARLEAKELQYLS